MRLQTVRAAGRTSVCSTYATLKPKFAGRASPLYSMAPLMKPTDLRPERVSRRI